MKIKIFVDLGIYFSDIEKQADNSQSPYFSITI